MRPSAATIGGANRLAWRSVLMSLNIVRPPPRRDSATLAFDAAGLADGLVHLAEAAERVGVLGLGAAAGNALNHHRPAFHHGLDQGPVGLVVGRPGRLLLGEQREFLLA